MKSTKRSPITDKPLHNPGQSLEEQRHDLLYDKLLAPFLMAWFLIVMAAAEWWYYLHPTERHPYLYTFIALGFLGYAGFQFWRTLPTLRQLKLGIEGEKSVGQSLEKLRENGYQIFHDLVGDGFNLDHVIIGPAGAFTIETKTISKPMRGEVKVYFDGETIRINGSVMDRDPVRQAKSQASWLRKILNESTGQDFTVHPVVLFPGWFVEQKAETRREIWVLEPKALPTFLANAPKVLTEERIKMVSGHLARFIRSQ